MTEQLDISKPIRELYDAINRRDASVFDRIVTENVEYTEFGLNETVHGREALKIYFQKWWKAFPKGNVEIRNLIVSNDQVVIEAVGSGFESGPFEMEEGTVRPLNQMLEFHFCKVFKIKDGLIVNGRSYSDSYKLRGTMSQEKRVA